MNSYLINMPRQDSVKFKAQRKKVKNVTKKAHDDYVKNYILNDLDQIRKSSGSISKQKDFLVHRLNAL